MGGCLIAQSKPALRPPSPPTGTPSTPHARKIDENTYRVFVLWYFIGIILWLPRKLVNC